MCIGIPMRVVECTGWLASCEGRGVRRTVDLALVDAQPVGTWVLVMQGSAREILTAEDARRIDRALDGLEAALEGKSDLSTFFEDLLARPPGAQEA